MIHGPKVVTLAGFQMYNTRVAVGNARFSSRLSWATCGSNSDMYPHTHSRVLMRHYNGANEVGILFKE